MHRSLLLLLVCSCHAKQVTVLDVDPTPCVMTAGAHQRPADVLFVVDNSGSMAEEQEQLAQGISRFLIGASGADLQIAVVTTDQVNDEEKSGRMSFEYATEHPNNLIAFDGNACTTAGIATGCFRGPDAGERIVRSEDAALVETFARNVRVGTCGSGREQGLKAMVSALSKTAPGGCNEGFLRQDADLILIFVSDEEDTDTTPISTYVDALRQLKPTEHLRVAAIVGSVKGQASICSANEQDRCGSLCLSMPPAGSQASCTPGSCPSGEFCKSTQSCEAEALKYWSELNCSWCAFYATPDCCSALPGRRYIDFAHAIGTAVAEADPRFVDTHCAGAQSACQIASICQHGLGNTLEQIASNLIARLSYRLDPPAPDPSLVAARITSDDAEPIDLTSADFTVSQDGTVLTITNTERRPQPDEVLEVYYEGSTCP